MKKVKRYLFPADYMADPSVHVYNDRVYIYPSHDWECNNVNNDSGDEYIMKDYHVLSTDDPMNGEVIDHGKVLDLEDIAWRGRQLWDCDVAEKDGKYYMYFPMKDRNEVFHHGVAIADNPAGPFIPLPEPIPGSYSIDNCVFNTKDGVFKTLSGGITGDFTFTNNTMNGCYGHDGSETNPKLNNLVVSGSGPVVCGGTKTVSGNIRNGVEWTQ